MENHKLTQGIVLALCTPFDEGGGLSVDRVPALIRSLLDANVGFKFTDTDFFRFQQLVDRSDGRLNALTGPDPMCLAGLVMGSDGAIGSSYNFMPRLFVGMYEAFRRGDIKSAMTAKVRANRVLSLFNGVGVFAGTKAILGWRGIPVGKPRLAAHGASPEALDGLRRAIGSLDFEVA